MRHSIRKETLNVKVATHETAWDLQPRLRDFNRNHLLPVIERVLNELAVAGRQIRIPALRLDLGQLPREGFEAVAAERLDHELRKALAEAIAGINRDSASGSQSQSEDESQLDSLDHYLQFGKLPFWGTPPSSFSLETALLELLESDPSGVHRLIRKLAGRPWPIQRLVLQLTEPTLERLLSLLQPQSAALIIAGMLELRDIQREATVPAVDRSRFATVLWISAFTYLLQEQGAGFNHISFVRYSLRCIADHESLDFLELLSSLQLAVSRLEKSRLVDLTLPATISELVREGEIGRARSSDEPLSASENAVSPSDSSFPAIIGGVVEEEQIAGADSPAHEPFADSSEITEVSTLTEENILALIKKIKKLLPQTGESANVFLTALRTHAGGAEDKTAFYSRVLRAMQEGKFLDLEELSRATSRGQVPFPQMEVREEQTTESHLPGHKPLGASGELIPSSIAEVSTPTEENILVWIKKLLPQTGGSANSFLTALRAHAAESEDKAAFYLRVLRAIQEGKILDLEELSRATSRGQVPFPQMEVSEEQTTGPHLPAYKPSGVSSELIPSSIEDVSTLTEEGILALIKKLLPQTGESANVFLTALQAYAAGVEDKPAFYFRVLRAMQEGRILDLEELSKTSPLTAEVPNLMEENILALIEKLLPQIGETGNLFLATLRAYAAGVEDKPAFYFRVLRAMQEGRILDLGEMSKTSPQEQAIFPESEEARDKRENTVERQVQPLVGQSTADGETHLPIPGTAASGLPQRFAKESERHQPGRQRPRVPATRARSTFSMPESQPSLPVGEPLYIDNAGLVLTAPFLPTLFNSLNMLRKDENGKSHWPDHETASRGVHLLQYLVDERVNAPEPLLVLNKLLCGLPPAMPVEKSITMTDGELAACEKLLRSMLANWKALSGTSIAGLRETFFQRQGRLEQSDLHWKLQVQRKTLDVLVDQIPWSISVIFHAWMPGSVHVTW